MISLDTKLSLGKKSVQTFFERPLLNFRGKIARLGFAANVQHCKGVFAMAWSREPISCLDARDVVVPPGEKVARLRLVPNVASPGPFSIR